MTRHTLQGRSVRDGDGTVYTSVTVTNQRGFWLQPAYARIEVLL